MTADTLPGMWSRVLENTSGSTGRSARSERYLYYVWTEKRNTELEKRERLRF